MEEGAADPQKFGIASGSTMVHRCMSACKRISQSAQHISDVPVGQCVVVDSVVL